MTASDEPFCEVCGWQLEPRECAYCQIFGCVRCITRNTEADYVCEECLKGDADANT